MLSSRMLYNRFSCILPSMILPMEQEKINSIYFPINSHHFRFEWAP